MLAVVWLFPCIILWKPHPTVKAALRWRSQHASSLKICRFVSLALKSHFGKRRPTSKLKTLQSSQYFSHLLAFRLWKCETLSWDILHWPVLTWHWPSSSTQIQSLCRRLPPLALLAMSHLYSQWCRTTRTTNFNQRIRLTAFAAPNDFLKVTSILEIQLNSTPFHFTLHEVPTSSPLRG